jgi:ubiquitin C-terminal hydrolase
LQKFNPENIQADCSEFLIFILDKLHEELKDIYFSNEEDNNENLNNG